MIALSAQDTSAEIPAVVLTAAQRERIGAFLRGYARRQQAGGGPETVVFTVYEFVEGLVYQSASQPQEALAFAWRNVARVYLSGIQVNGAGKRLISYQYRLETPGGGWLTVSGKCLMASLAYRARRQPPDVERELYFLLSKSQLVVSQHLLPLARRELAEGKKVLFAEVTVSNAGLHTEDGLIPWPSIRSVKVVDGSLVVRVKGWGRPRPALDLPMSRIPNSPLLMALVSDLMEDG